MSSCSEDSLRSWRARRRSSETDDGQGGADAEDHGVGTGGEWPATARRGGRCAGTGGRTEDRSVFVARHGSFVEDELDVDQVDVWADASDELRHWPGAIEVIDASTARARDLTQHP